MGESRDRKISFYKHTSFNSKQVTGLEVFQILSVEKNKILEIISSTLSPKEITNLGDKTVLSQSQTASTTDLPQYTLYDVSYHDTPSDCWIIIYDYVYDITSFLTEHPVGEEVILEYAGHDATLSFKGVGHSKIAEESLKKYLIGILVPEERLW